MQQIFQFVINITPIVWQCIIIRMLADNVRKGQSMLTSSCQLLHQRRVQQCKRSDLARSLWTQALAIQLDRCLVQISKMATMIIMGFHEGLCAQVFRLDFRNDYVCFFLWIYGMELEQSDSDKGPRIILCSEKRISISVTILIIVHRTKPIFRHEQ